MTALSRRRRPPALARRRSRRTPSPSPVGVLVTCGPERSDRRVELTRCLASRMGNGGIQMKAFIQIARPVSGPQPEKQTAPIIRMQFNSFIYSSFIHRSSIYRPSFCSSAISTNLLVYYCIHLSIMHPFINQSIH